MWRRYYVAFARIVMLAIVLNAFAANAVGQNFAHIGTGDKPGLSSVNIDDVDNTLMIGLAALLLTLFLRHHTSLQYRVHYATVG